MPADITITVEGNVGPGGGGVGLLNSIEQILKRIHDLIERQQRSMQTSVSMNQQINNQWRQTAVQVTQVNNTFINVERSIERVKEKTSAWTRALEGAAKTIKGFSAGLSSFNRGGGLSGIGDLGIGRIGRESFGDLFGGGGIGGVAGAAVKLPFAVAEFGLKMGGELASKAAEGFTRVIGALGGGLSQTVYGAIIGIPLQLGGSLLGAAGGIAGGLLEAGGGLLGKVGELGGAIAEKLVGAVSKGLAVGATAAVGYGAFAVTKGLDLEKIRPTFDRQTEGIGGQAAVMDRLRESSRGLISDYNLMLQANRALQLGAATSADELAFLTDASVKLGRAMGVDATQAFERLTLGIGKQSPELLDELGIVVRASDAYRDYALVLGKSTEALTSQERRLAVMARVYEQTEQAVGKVGNQNGGAKDTIDRLGVAFDNMTTRLGVAFIPALTRVLEAVTPLVERFAKWAENNRDVIEEKTLEGVKRLVGLFEDGLKAYDHFKKSIEERGWVGAFQEAIDETRTFWGPWLEFAKQKIDELAAYISLKISGVEVRAKEAFWDSAVKKMTGSVGMDMPSGTAPSVKKRIENNERPSDARWIGFGYMPHTSYGKAFHGPPLGNEMSAFNLGDAFNYDGEPESRPTVQTPLGRTRALMAPENVEAERARKADDALNEALEDMARGLSTQADRLREKLEKDTDRLDSALKRARDVDERAGSIRLESDRRKLEIEEAGIAERQQILSRKAAALAAAPSAILDGYQGDAELPGVGLHARNALRRPAMLARRERAREINGLFGSKGISDPFSGAQSGGDLGFGGMSKPGGGLSGSDTAATARQQLLAVVQTSAAYAAEQAKLQAEEFNALKQSKEDEMSARKDLDRQTFTALQKLTDLNTTSIQAIRELVNENANLRSKISALEASQAEIRQIARRKI